MVRAPVLALDLFSSPSSSGRFLLSVQPNMKILKLEMFSDQSKLFLKSKSGYIIFISAFTLFLFFATPFSHIIFIPCWFKELTGLKCPACGGLRGIHLIFYGNIWEGLKYNILLMFVPLIFFPIYKRTNLNSLKFIIPVLLVLLLFTFLQNSSLYPFY